MEHMLFPSQSPAAPVVDDEGSQGAGVQDEVHDADGGSGAGEGAVQARPPLLARAGHHLHYEVLFLIRVIF